jgi:hypothetical protein
VADNRALLLAAGAVLLVGAAYLGTSASAKAKAGGQLKLAADSGGTAQAGASGSMQIRNGVTPQSWTPYCPPGAHTGPHRMYQHPKNSSPNFTRLTTAPDAYDWVFSPPSEVDL